MSKVASLAAYSTNQCIHLGKRLCHEEISLRTVNEAVKPLAPRPGLHNYLLRQFEEHITSLKAELEDIVQPALLLEDEGPLEQHSMLAKALYDLDLKVKRLLYAYKRSPSTPEYSAGLKLLRIDVPTFDSNILDRYTF